MLAPQSQRRCLLTDAMGTLVRLSPPAPRLRLELSRRLGIEVSLDQAQRAISAEIRFYRAHMHEGRDEASVRALHGRCAKILREALPESERMRTVDEASMTDVLLSSLRLQVFDDAPGALRAARRANLRVLVVSNWDASLPEVLGRVGLAPLLDGVVTSAGVGVGKPHPGIFQAALDRAGVSADCAVHVGDSLEEDVAGARAAGIAPVWLNRDGDGHPPDVPAITTLSDLALWL